MKIQAFKWTMVLAFAVVTCVTMGPASQYITAQDTEIEEKQEEDSVDDLMRKAMTAARQGEFDEAVENAEAAMKLDDENFQIQAMLINLLQQSGMTKVQDGERTEANPYFYRAGEVARLLLKNETAMEEFGPQIKQLCSGAVYNEACTFSLDEKKEEAFKSLKLAFELGFDDYELAMSDSDFDNINDSDEFKSLVENAKVEAVERMAAEAKEELDSFESFDFDFELEDIEGETVALKDFAGKIMIVDFWGTWCPPCREEIPSFIKLKETYGGDKFDIVGINYERAEGDEAIEMITEYMEDNDMNYNCLVGDDDTLEQIDIEGYPTTLFVDAKGKVRLKLVGLHSYEKLESIVKALLNEKTGG